MIKEPKKHTTRLKTFSLQALQFFQFSQFFQFFQFFQFCQFFQFSQFYFYNTPNASSMRPPMHPKCVANASLMRPQCILNTFPMQSQCVHNVSSILSNKGPMLLHDVRKISEKSGKEGKQKSGIQKRSQSERLKTNRSIFVALSFFLMK